MSVRGVRLRIASLGQPETRIEYRRELADHLRRHHDRLSPEARARIELNPMRAFDATDPGTREVMGDAPKLLDRLAPEDAEHFAAVRELLDATGLRYELDPTLVRGLDYYTRTLFEFTSDELGAQSGVAGGGRYDRLVEQLGGQRTPGCGWAAGVERILIAGGVQPSAPDPVDLFVALARRDSASATAAFELAREARRAGLATQLELAGRSMKGQLKHADRLGARYVAILREDGEASLKEMGSGEQLELDVAAVIPTILRGERL
jgi:histidyl-tRNA synthetase